MHCKSRKSWRAELRDTGSSVQTQSRGQSRAVSPGGKFVSEPAEAVVRQTGVDYSLREQVTWQ